MIIYSINIAIYRSDSVADVSQILGQTRHSLGPDVQASLDTLSLSVEIPHVIKAMQSKGRAPGSDGLPLEFYKVLADKLSPMRLPLKPRSLYY